MFAKCSSCFKALTWRLIGHSQPKWQSHLHSFCTARRQKQPWCDMFLDNIDLISQHILSKEAEHLIRNTNIASEIVQIITNQYSQENNLFRFCIELFGSYLKLKYSQTVNPSKNTLHRIAHEHQDFTQLLIDLFVLYYGLQDRQIVGQQIFYKFTLPTLANHFAFDNQDIAATINRTAKMSLKGQIDKVQFQIQRFTTYTIKEYMLRDELQLNQRTLALFNKPQEKTQERLYSGAAQIIKEIVRVNSPAEKIRLVEGLQKQIESSVLNFYKKHNLKLERIEISPKDLNSILIYILVQANLPIFVAHLHIAILFCVSNPRAQSILEALTTACQLLEKGSVTRKQYSNLSTQTQPLRQRKYSDGPGFFDEVSNIDL